jgi:hypothetical protein
VPEPARAAPATRRDPARTGAQDLPNLQHTPVVGFPLQPAQTPTPNLLRHTRWPKKSPGQRAHVAQPHGSPSHRARPLALWPWHLGGTDALLHPARHRVAAQRESGPPLPPATGPLPRLWQAAPSAGAT